MSRYLKALKSAPAIVSAIAFIFLVIGIFPIKEYDFYIVLRCVVFLASLFLLIRGVDKRSSYFWAFMLIGILFNPIRPFHINKLTWLFLDAAAASVFVLFLINELKIIKRETK